MKLTNFTYNGTTEFGFSYQGKLFPFSRFERILDPDQRELLKNMEAYLSNIDQSFPSALRVQHHVGASLQMLSEGVDYFPEQQVRLEMPLVPRVFLDFLTSPRHVYASARTLVRHEYPRMLEPLIAALMLRQYKRVSKHCLKPEIPDYYKGIVDSFASHDTPLIWPSYTSYLDVEPELGFVTGRSNVRQIAGYVFINDCSARDVQVPDQRRSFMGPQRSKDFQTIIGPYLVTPDEVEDPFNLDVTVHIGDRYVWKGSTCDYNMSADETLAFMQTIYDVKPGTLVAHGTIPGCCGLDNDLWVRPGEEVTMEFAGLGRMRSSIELPERISRAQATRWGERQELKPFYTN